MSTRRIVKTTNIRLRRGQSLASQAYSRIKDEFALGQMQPGRRLTFRDVAREFGISVTPAREALFMLAAEHVVEVGANGTILVPELNETICIELWRIRLLLEAHCAEAATARINSRVIDQMQDVHMQMAQAKQALRLKDAMKHNLAFHFLLYRSADLPILVSLIEGIWARSAAYVKFFHTDHVGRRNAAAAQGPHVHTTILAGLRAGDPNRVKRGIERDLLEVRDGILRRLREVRDEGSGFAAMESSAPALGTARRQQRRAYRRKS